MKTNTLMMIAAAALVLSGCNKAETPADVKHDVAEAQAEGSRDVADARADAQKDSIDAGSDVAKAAADHNVNDVIDQAHEAGQVAAEGDAKVQLAKAEATHKVAIEKCEALSGDAQKDCKGRADTTLDMAKKHDDMKRDAAH